MPISDKTKQTVKDSAKALATGVFYGLTLMVATVIVTTTAVVVIKKIS